MARARRVKKNAGRFDERAGCLVIRNFFLA